MNITAWANKAPKPINTEQTMQMNPNSIKKSLILLFVRKEYL